MNGKGGAARTRALSVGEPQRQKLSLNLAGDVFATVKEIADWNATTVTDVLRRAISLYVFVDAVRREKGTVFISKDEGETLERVHLL
jgi:hypothetical protein